MRAAKLLTVFLAAPAFASLPGCTDLTETPASSITPENFYKNEEEVLGGLASVYSQMRISFPGYTDGGYWTVSEVSSDEMIVPTRGNDWADGGRWLDIDAQRWTVSSPGTLSDINNVWVPSFIGIARANVLLAALENVAVPNEAVIAAEARTLRAFYYYMLMDMFGGVPIVTEIEIAARPQNTRQEVFDFIETELNEARTALPASWPANQHGRMTQGAADAILASMYLNAQVFTGTVTATGLQPGTARWADAIVVADRIINSGVYSLSTDWRVNFRHDNHLSPENILVVKFLAEPDLGLRFLNASLHYNQFTPGPWNGFSILADAYNQFDANDQRRQAFLVGPQVNVEDGTPICERPGCAAGGVPLVFTVTIGDATAARENEGVRFLKWPVDPNHNQPDNGNDFAWFRLAEIYLIKAEAQFELGNPGGALLILNQLRARAFEPDEDLTAVTRDVILRERLFELAAEGKRRQDLIRHGRFTEAWTFKPVTDPYRILMPIPQTQLDANPMLVQNPGY
ncbi:MAG: RagB/SusD family nutrient uptake outer membrane protein [Gemmatimonadaceae bacterium]